ncbi:MAG: hypothetical protein ACI8S6_001427 [Myxococcota bacterium]|jgi:hypothetical protein
MSKHVRPASSLQSHRQDAASNLIIENIMAGSAAVKHGEMAAPRMQSYLEAEPSEGAGNISTQNARTVIMSRVEVLALANELNRPAPQVPPPLAVPVVDDDVDSDAASVASQLWKAAEGVLLGVLIAAAGTAMSTVISTVLMMAVLSSAP